MTRGAGPLWQDEKWSQKISLFGPGSPEPGWPTSYILARWEIGGEKANDAASELERLKEAGLMSWQEENWELDVTQS